MAVGTREHALGRRSISERTLFGSKEKCKRGQEWSSGAETPRLVPVPSDAQKA